MKDYKTTLSGKQQLHVLRRIMSYLKPHKLLLGGALSALIISIIFDSAAPLITKHLIDNYITNENFVMNEIIALMGIYIFCSLLYAFFQLVSTVQFNKIGNRITQKLRVELFEKLQYQGMSYFDKTPAGSLVSRVTNDTEAVQDMLINVLSVILSGVLIMVSVIVIMFLINPVLALIAVIFLPMAFLCIFFFQKYSTRNYQNIRERNSEINARLSEGLSGMNIVQEFNQQERIVNEFSKVNDEYYQATLTNIKIEGLLLSPMIHLLTSLSLALMILISGLQSLHTLISIGSLLAFTELIYRLFDPVFQMMDRLAIYQQSIVSAHRIFSILDHTEKTPPQTVNTQAHITNAMIEFKHVTFSYDGKNDVLKDISFKVNPGETVALVGHTGSGKSSIINLIMRFYEFTQGDILIDGYSIKEFPIEELRSKIGLVLQEPFLYYGSISDNIRLLNKEITDEQIVEACCFVKADMFIESLEDKYQHLVTERGSLFSFGQKQLLAFARTMVLNPRILILDEATANIDTETEQLIQEGLDKMRQGRTTIAIAHRLSTVKDANMILVLDQGRIVETGNHDALIQKKGLYYAMYELQKNDMDVDNG